MARENTNYLLDCIDEGYLTTEQVLAMCLTYMSEAQVTDMMEYNDLPISEEV